MWSLVYLFIRTLVALLIGTGQRGRVLLAAATRVLPRDR